MNLHKTLHTPLRAAIASTLVGIGGLPLLGPRWTVPLVLLLAAGVVGTAWVLWYGLRGPGAALAALEARWLALHGARSLSPCAIGLHDGHSPLTIHLQRAGADLCARVTTLAPPSTLTFRLWPADGAPPSFVGSATRDIALDLSRVPDVEQRFAMLFRAESNAPQALSRLIGTDLLAALLTVRKESPAGTFRGLTWDGRELAVHWTGALAADPERALQLSRPLWRDLVGEE